MKVCGSTRYTLFPSTFTCPIRAWSFRFFSNETPSDSASLSVALNPILCLVFSYLLPGFPKPTITNGFVASGPKVIICLREEFLSLLCPFCFCMLFRRCVSTCNSFDLFLCATTNAWTQFGFAPFRFILCCFLPFRLHQIQFSEFNKKKPNCPRDPCCKVQPLESSTKEEGAMGDRVGTINDSELRYSGKTAFSNLPNFSISPSYFNQSCIRFFSAVPRV